MNRLTKISDDTFVFSTIKTDTVGSYPTVCKAMVDDGFDLVDVVTAVAEMNEKGHNIAEFGQWKSLMFTDTVTSFGKVNSELTH